MTKKATKFMANLSKVQEQKNKNQTPLTLARSADPDYMKMGPYVKVETHRAVQKLLIDQPDLTMSDLVQTLLAEWVEDNS